MKYRWLKLGVCSLYLIAFFWITAARYEAASKQGFPQGFSPLPGGLMLMAFPFVACYFLVLLIKLIPYRKPPSQP